MVEQNEENIAYVFSLLMKKHGKLTQSKAVRQLKNLLDAIEPFVNEEEFWELTEVHETIEMMDLEEFEQWKKIAKQFFLTVSN